MATFQIELPNNRVYNPEKLHEEMIKAKVPGFTGVSTRDNRIFVCILDEHKEKHESDSTYLLPKIHKCLAKHDPEKLTERQQKLIDRNLALLAAHKHVSENPSPVNDALKHLLEDNFT